MALEIRGPLDPKVRNQFFNLARREFDASLAGEKEPRIVRDFPASSFLILVATPEIYENLDLGEAISSVCRL